MLYGELTPEENLHFYGTLYGMQHKYVVSRADELIELVEMSDHRRTAVKLLSQGQRKRISIARALMHDPPILLLDEPFSALDSSARTWLARLLERSTGKTILLSTHQPDQDLPSAHRSLVLVGGLLSADRRAAVNTGNTETNLDLEGAWL
jgi:ABC-type multidrug transport system ATPase subunit